MSTRSRPSLIRELSTPVAIAGVGLASSTAMLLATGHTAAVLPVWIGGMFGIVAAVLLIALIPDEIVAAMSGGVLTLLAGLTNSQTTGSAGAGDGTGGSRVVEHVLSQARTLSIQINTALAEIGVRLEGSTLSIAILAACGCSSLVGLLGPLMVRRAEVRRMKELEALASNLGECCPNLLDNPQWLRACAEDASSRRKLHERLEGRWDYEVSVSGQTYRHSGKCRFAISDSGKLGLSGERLRTWSEGSAPPNNGSVSQPIHWEAQHLALVQSGAGAGLMFDYYIDILETRRHGLCIIFPATDDGRFVGEYAYVSLGGKKSGDARAPEVPDAVSCGQIVFSNRMLDGHSERG